MNRLNGLDFAFLLKGRDNIDISFDKELVLLHSRLIQSFISSVRVQSNSHKIEHILGIYIQSNKLSLKFVTRKN